jgi:hypothetical protein
VTIQSYAFRVNSRQCSQVLFRGLQHMKCCRQAWQGAIMVHCKWSVSIKSIPSVSFFHFSSQFIAILVYACPLWWCWSCMCSYITMLVNCLQMSMEFQVPSPLVPTRECYFVRYCKNNPDGTWAVVDVSMDSLRPGPVLKCRRRPSGCVIQEMPNGYSKVN